MDVVQIVSGLTALITAYDGAGRDLTEYPLAGMMEVVEAHANDDCDKHLLEAMRNNHPIDDPVAYRRLYVETFLAFYAWGSYAFTHGIYVLSPELTEEERVRTMDKWVQELLTPRG